METNNFEFVVQRKLTQQDLEIYDEMNKTEFGGFTIPKYHKKYGFIVYDINSKTTKGIQANTNEDLKNIYSSIDCTKLFELQINEKINDNNMIIIRIW